MQAWSKANDENKSKFINTFIQEAGVDNTAVERKLRLFYSQLPNKNIARMLINGVTKRFLLITDKRDEFIVNPLNNIYFQRDNFCCVGNCITINKMKYTIRQRESLLSEFVFNNHPKFKNVKKVYSRNESNTIEGGDIFPYTKDTLVIGISERTTIDAVIKLASNLKEAKASFKEIVCINVPKVGRLMHLDT
jgi:arginine deiminase